MQRPLTRRRPYLAKKIKIIIIIAITSTDYIVKLQHCNKYPKHEFILRYKFKLDMFSKHKI